MALFGRKKTADTKTDSAIAKAILTPSVLAMIADGSIDNSEVHQLANLCGYSPIFASMAPDDTITLLNQILSDFNETGPMPVLMAASKALPMPLRETAFIFAARIALADGVLDEEEKKTLAVTARVLGLSKDSFDKILDVVLMMQRSAMAA